GVMWGRCGCENEAGGKFGSWCGAGREKSEDDTTVTLAIEDRAELDDELGAMLAEIPAGTGVVVVRRGPNAGSRFSLERDVTTVGRHPDSDIFLDDITVSRRPAVIRRDPDRHQPSPPPSPHRPHP